MELFDTTVKKYPIRFLVGIGFLLYFYSLFNYFVGDDFDQIVNNAFVQNIGNAFYFFRGGTFDNGFVSLSGIYFKPIMTLIFSLLYTFFKDNSFFYHLTQLSFHIANSVLIFLVFKKFFTKKPSYLAALLFLIHPINTEAVVYVSNLQDVLFTFFGLLSFYIFITFKISLKILGVVFILLLLSLLSKETGILFAFILLLYSFLLKKSGLKTLILVGSAVGLYSLLRINAVGIYSYHNENFPMMQLAFFERMLGVPSMVFYYVKTFLWPINLAFAQNWTVKEPTFLNFYIPLFVLIVIALTLLFGGSKYFKTSKFRLYLFFSIWLLTGLSLHMQILPLDMTVADRWFYFPFIGLLGILLTVFNKFDFLSYKKWISYIFILVFILLFALSFSRSLNWQNQFTLYGHDAKYNTSSFSLQNGWALELMNIGKYSEAEKFVRRSIELEPNFCYSWNNLGSIYIQKKDFESGRKFYKEALKRDPCPMAYNNLATLLYYHFDQKEAYEYTRASLKEYPNSARLWLMMALLEHKAGNKEMALKAAKNSLKYQNSTAAQYVFTNIRDDVDFELKEF